MVLRNIRENADMKWPEFGYARAQTLDDLWALRGASSGEARLIAGGQSLLAALAFRLSQPDQLIDISGLEALRGISETATHLRLGALTRHVDLQRDPLVARHAPLLAEAAPLIAHPAIRNRGTLGGSLAYADPAAELPACMLALEATIVALSPRGERRIAAQDFFLGLFETALAEDELISAVEVPRQQAGHRVAILEVARRSGDYAMAGLACRITLDGAQISQARLVYFGADSRAVLAERASAALVGARLGESDAALASALAALTHDLDPPDDLHGPGAMKRHLAGVLTGRALRRFRDNEKGAA